jgi:hypothetical protein
MGILLTNMKRVVREQRLTGYLANVCPDGTPNLTANGTTAVSDDDHLVFADIRSPQSIQDIEHNPPRSRSISSGKTQLTPHVLDRRASLANEDRPINGFHTSAFYFCLSCQMTEPPSQK